MPERLVRHGAVLCHTRRLCADSHGCSRIISDTRQTRPRSREPRPGTHESRPRLLERSVGDAFGVMALALVVPARNAHEPFMRNIFVRRRTTRTKRANITHRRVGHFWTKEEQPRPGDPQSPGRRKRIESVDACSRRGRRAPTDRCVAMIPAQAEKNPGPRPSGGFNDRSKSSAAVYRDPVSHSKRGGHRKPEGRTLRSRSSSRAKVFEIEGRGLVSRKCDDPRKERRCSCAMS